MTALMVDDEIGRVALMVDGLVGVERVETSMLSDLTQRVGVVRRYFLSVERAVVGIVTPSALLAPVVRALAALTTERDSAAAARHDFTRTRADYRRILTIRVGAEIVALALERVERILPAVPLTSLPGDGAGFHGLSDIGDVVVPVLDLRIRLEQPVSDEPAVLIVVLLDAAPAGILVSEVLRIEDVPVDAFVSVAHSTSLPVAQTVRMGEQHVPLLLLERLLPNPPTIPGPGRHRSM
jgi:chemotaxis signal transduction protein